MIGSDLLFAVVPGEGRPQLSPLLGYASFMLVVTITCLGVWLLVRTARRADTGGDDGGDGEESGGGPGGGGGGRRAVRVRGRTAIPTGGRSSSARSPRT